MANQSVEIYDIMACNVYWDFENTGLQKEQHKFLVSFYPVQGTTIPELVESITAYGPDGYQVKLENQVFTGQNRNGHIYDRTTNGHWYMVNLDTGFMKEGKYTIEVRCKNGDVKTMSRVQKNAPSETLVSVYQKQRQAIYDSQSLSKTKPVPAGTPLKNIELSWSSLKQLGDLDAFYIFRLSEGRSSKEFNTQKLVWWDNIFVQRAKNPNAGLNTNKVVIAAELKPASSYVYFTEITDSNAMGSTNICIFQPHQVFVTP